MKERAIAWDAIVATLEGWRAHLDSPSVTTVAERYSHDAWAVLVSTILSLRTKDEVTLATSAALLEQAPTPEALLALPLAAIEKLAYPAGFYRTKAANLVKIAGILVECYGSKPPADMEALLALPGVGRKTANLVLIEAYDMDGVCVDTHVHRISNRQGWVATDTPEQTEMELRRILPRCHWKTINPILVLYGQQICRPVSPFCSKCVVSSHCKRRGTGKTR